MIPWGRHYAGRYLLFVLLLSGMAGGAFGHSLKQKLGQYQDNQGMNRQRLGMDAALQYQGSGGPMSSHGWNVSLSRDLFTDRNVHQTGGEATEDKYAKEVYGTGQRVSASGTVSATQTWNKITETRALVSMTKDERTDTRTGSLGASQWIFHETVQCSLDVSRTLTERPLFEILDVDFEVISPPVQYTATGITAGLRHLVTPTTLMQYAYTRMDSNDRPPSHTYSYEIRQFIPLVDGAIHGSVARALNRGKMTLTTAYGEVSAWQTEISALKNLWRGARSRMSYRLYKEDETTRAYGDELVFGSDMITLSLAQEIPAGAIGNFSLPLSIEGGVSRYVTNTTIAANTMEMALAAKF